MLLAFCLRLPFSFAAGIICVGEGTDEEGESRQSKIEQVFLGIAERFYSIQTKRSFYY